MTDEELKTFIGTQWREKARPGRVVEIVGISKERRGIPNKLLMRTITTHNKRKSTLNHVVELNTLHKRFELVNDHVRSDSPFVDARDLPLAVGDVVGIPWLDTITGKMRIQTLRVRELVRLTAGVNAVRVGPASIVATSQVTKLATS